MSERKPFKADKGWTMRRGYPAAPVPSTTLPPPPQKATPPPRNAPPGPRQSRP
jgi:hypothetical protein